MYGSNGRGTLCHGIRPVPADSGLTANVSISGATLGFPPIAGDFSYEWRGSQGWGSAGIVLW